MQELQDREGREACAFGTMAFINAAMIMDRGEIHLLATAGFGAACSVSLTLARQR